ncbi:secreted RxLR effector protein 161-like [Solanum lycopersicum]|uniref:secreted RxLR effector protein 161-like n=1 Tax=Solanum lycopersicum TaxID=4081 RepID=UPI0002BC8E18|nr:uncharacterized protein LOC109119622 [Solanum lycopersicum]
MLKAMLVGKGYNQNEGLDYGEHSALLQLDCYDEVHISIPPGLARQGVNNAKYDKCIRIQVLTQYMHYSKDSHMEATLREVSYIKEAPSLGLFMPAENTNLLLAYCDSDWGSCIETTRSLIGYLVKFGGALISWKLKKQAIVSRSSVEA